MPVFSTSKPLPLACPKLLCLHELFERQVSQTPDAIAAIFQNQSITYRELDRRANQLAHYLLKVGVSRDSLVSVCIERCLEMIISIIGILKARGAYVPLDPDHPKERLASILSDTGSPVILTMQRFAGRLPKGKSRILCLDADWPRIAREKCQKPAAQGDPEQCAYAIFTSGSTGKPKGVLVPHRAIVSHMRWIFDVFRPQPNDRVLQRIPYTFDPSISEFFLPLMSGAALVVPRPGGDIQAAYLAHLIVREKVTIAQFVPSILRIFLEADAVRECSTLRIVSCGGEALSPDLQALFFAKLRCDLYNLYGPTECTIDSTFWKCDRDSERPVLPIGRPISDVQVYILDRELEPVSMGVAGELYVGGAGIARGYLNRPNLTSERFIPDPFSPEPGARLYKTGDLARHLPSGDIEYLGRMDRQVKLRGLRIELGEIETALGEHPGIRESVVIAEEHSPGEKRLIAYLVAQSRLTPDPDELRRFLLKSLPDYLVPSLFVPLQAIPRMPNGKVDWHALPAPPQPDLANEQNFAEPKDILESRLVAMWESVLGVRPIGLKAHFFELGGHSLMAVRLMHRIEQAFGKNLPIATLFQAPTVERLAAIIRQKGWSSRWSSLVPIQAEGSKTPFFCIHGIEANVFRFHHLAQYLGSDQPFYGLQAQGVNRNYPFHTRVEDMAAHYIQEIRSVQPGGPYLLGGYSFGGMIALEMAQQLVARGCEPPLVVLFDTHFFSEKAAPHSRNGEPASSVWLNRLRISRSQTRTYLSRIVTAPLRTSRRWLRVRRLPPRVKQAREACLEAARAYVPRPYPGRMILFRSNYLPLSRFVDAYAGWNAYAAQGMQTYYIEGHHENILLEPTVRRVAEQLRKCLHDAERDFNLHSQVTKSVLKLGDVLSAC